MAGIRSHCKCFRRTRYCCLLPGLHGLRDPHEESHGNCRCFGISPSNGTVSLSSSQHSNSTLCSDIIHYLWFSGCSAHPSFSCSPVSEENIIPVVLHCCWQKRFCASEMLLAALSKPAEEQARAWLLRTDIVFILLQRFCGDTQERCPLTCQRT